MGTKRKANIEGMDEKLVARIALATSGIEDPKKIMSALTDILDSDLRAMLVDMYGSKVVERARRRTNSTIRWSTTARQVMERVRGRGDIYYLHGRGYPYLRWGEDPVTGVVGISRQAEHNWRHVHDDELVLDLVCEAIAERM